MLRGQFAKIFPHGVLGNVCDYHKLSAISRGAARADVRSDTQAVDSRDIGLRQAWRGAVSETGARFVKQKN